VFFFEKAKFKYSYALHKGMWGGVNLQLHLFLTLTLDGGEWSASRLGRFKPLTKSPVPSGRVENSGYFCKEGISSHYTNWAIQAQFFFKL
jgi:hypothetical protein